MVEYPSKLLLDKSRTIRELKLHNDGERGFRSSCSPRQRSRMWTMAEEEVTLETCLSECRNRTFVSMEERAGVVPYL